MDKNKTVGLRSGEVKECLELRKLLAKRTGTCPDDWFLTFRAREALQVALEEIRLHSGHSDAVIQPLTCSTVAEAVLAGGMKPVYTDISTDNLSLDPEKVFFTENTAAIVIQHTFGMIDAPSMLKAKDASHAAGAVLIEDCAQCSSRMAFDTSAKPIADISVHSFGLEKMTSTYFGAAVWIDPEMADTDLHDSLIKHFSSLPPSDRRVSKSVPSYLTRIRILNHMPSALRRHLRDRWTAKRKFIPGIAPVELKGGTLLDPSVPGHETVSRVLDALKSIDDNESQRSAAVRMYADAFRHNKAEFAIPSFALDTDQPLLWFPVIAENEDAAERITSALNTGGYYSSGWGRPLLFPGVKDPAAFRLEEALFNCPISKKSSDGMILLPTKVSAEDAVRILEIVSGTES